MSGDIPGFARSFFISFARHLILVALEDYWNKRDEKNPLKELFRKPTISRTLFIGHFSE